MKCFNSIFIQTIYNNTPKYLNNILVIVSLYKTVFRDVVTYRTNFRDKTKHVFLYAYCFDCIESHFKYRSQENRLHGKSNPQNPHESENMTFHFAHNG